MKTTTIALIALMGVSSAHANWIEHSYVDEMTDVETSGAYSNSSDNARIGVECISDGSAKGRVRLEFGAGKVVATPSSDIALKVRVDKNIPIDIQGKLFSNSHKSGFSYLDKLDPKLQQDLLSQLISGSGYIVRYYKFGETLTLKGNLKGSKPRILKMLDGCDYKHFTAVTERLDIDYDEYLKSLEAGKGNRRKAELKKLAELKERYLMAIQQRVTRRWINPGVGKNASCEVRLRQIPGGEIIYVNVVSCAGGGAELERSVERATLKASPLPAAPDPRLFERIVEFVFKP